MRLDERNPELGGMGIGTVGKMKGWVKKAAGARTLVVTLGALRSRHQSTNVLEEEA